MFLTVRCAERATIVVLTSELFEKFLEESDELRKKVRRFVIKLERQNISYLMDLLPRCNESGRKYML